MNNSHYINNNKIILTMIANHLKLNRFIKIILISYNLRVAISHYQIKEVQQLVMNIISKINPNKNNNHYQNNKKIKQEMMNINNNKIKTKLNKI